MKFSEDLEQIRKSNNQPLILIGNYLESRTDVDKDKFENKSIAQCFEFIKGEAKKRQYSGCACLTDEEVFGLAVHYYDEEDIKVASVQAKVTTSTTNTKPTADKEKEKLKEEVARLKSELAKKVPESKKLPERKPKPKKEVKPKAYEELTFDLFGADDE